MPLLFTVAFQLKFPEMCDAGLQAASETPQFDCGDWTPQNVGRRVKNALAYLDYNASRFRDRNSAARWHYLNGRRALHDAFFGLRFKPRPLLLSYSLFASPSPNQCTTQTLAATWSRGRIVDALLVADASLSDRVLLMRLSRAKLMSMLERAWETAARRERRSA